MVAWRESGVLCVAEMVAWHGEKQRCMYHRSKWQRINGVTVNNGSNNGQKISAQPAGAYGAAASYGGMRSVAVSLI